MRKVSYTNQYQPSKGTFYQNLYFYDLLIGSVETSYENDGWSNPEWYPESKLGDLLGTLDEKGLTSQEIIVMYARKLCDFIGENHNIIERVDWQVQGDHSLLWSPGIYTRYKNETMLMHKFDQLKTLPEYKQLQWLPYRYRGPEGMSIGALVCEFAIEKVQAEMWTHPQYQWSPVYFKAEPNKISSHIFGCYKNASNGRTGQVGSWHRAQTIVQQAFTELVNPRILL